MTPSIYGNTLTKQHQQAIAFLKQKYPGYTVDGAQMLGWHENASQVFYLVRAREPDGQWANYLIMVTSASRGFFFELFSSVMTGVLPR